MHCSRCEADIADAIRKVPGVDNVEVSLARNEASIHHEAAIDEDLLRAAVSSPAHIDSASPKLARLPRQTRVPRQTMPRKVCTRSYWS